MARGMPEIVFHLNTRPCFRSAAEGLGETNGHFWRDSGTAIDQFRQGFARDTQCPCGCRDGQPKRLEAILADQFSWMGRVVHTHMVSSLWLNDSPQDRHRPHLRLQTQILFASSLTERPPIDLFVPLC